MNLQPWSIGFVGAGRVAQVLTVGLLRSGWRVQHVASLSEEEAQAMVDRVSGAVPERGPDRQPVPRPTVCEAQALVDRCDWVLLAVPDDAIESACAGLRWRPGQWVVHLSAATPLSALATAQAQGAVVGGWHPLQIFSDPVAALEALPGSYAAIEATDSGLKQGLHRLTAQLGMHALTLPAQGRVRYHIAANYMASFLLPLMAEAEVLWASAGLPRQAAMQALVPLARGTLGAVMRRGVAGAVSGPMARADVHTLSRHLEALAGMSPPHRAFYLDLVQRQMALLALTDRLSPAQRESLEAFVAAQVSSPPQ